MINTDIKKDTAIKILKEKLNIKSDNLKRFTTGYCHSVYYVESDGDRFVLRITDKENEIYYQGSVKWLKELHTIGIPVPKILKHGEYDGVFYNLITYIDGRDLGDVYHTLNGFQKRDVARDLSAVQKKMSALPASCSYGYNSFPTWIEYLESSINRSFERIKQNNIFDISVCDKAAMIMRSLHDYFSQIKPLPFLDDITTKNVLINNGKLAGIVDVDEVCYGDLLSVIGLTNMALLLMGADTDYTEFWLDEINADKIQRKAVLFYTLLSCVDFMGEQGMRFNNGTVVTVNQKKIDLLNSVYNNLITAI